MVVIRKLSLPSKPKAGLPRQGKDQRKHVVRRRADFPPPTPQPTPCVLWQGAVDGKGYGRFKEMRDGRQATVYIHRHIVELATGRKLRKQDFILHACDNPPCYRFDHLSVGTVQDNNADMVAKKRNKKPPVNRLNGASNGNAKLTAKDIERVKKMHQQGLSSVTIAKAFEVHPSTIYKITRGLTWRPPTRDLLAEAREKVKE